MSIQHASAEPAVLTVEEAAKFLRISRQSAYQAVHSGDLPSIRVGRRLLVSRAALERLLAEGGERSRPGTTKPWR
jgi:excisionase family DNA binding protein